MTPKLNTVSNQQGYYRNPTVSKNQIVFVCEDDLWAVSSEGGRAYQVTNLRGEISDPLFSPDGQWIACCGREEGNADVYILPAMGGPLQRLTYLNAAMKIVSWSPDCENIIFCSSHRSFHRNWDTQLFSVPVKGGPIQPLPFGHAYFLSFSPSGKGIILGRNAPDNSRWKRYRGGMQGELWIDLKGKGDFKPFLEKLEGNPVNPMWIGNRIYFISDHEGIGNIYSCSTDGKDLKAETKENDFYVRYPSTDGEQIVYQSGADLFLFDIKTTQKDKIPIKWTSSRTMVQRKFFHGYEYLEDVSLHPDGFAIALTSRGKLFAMPLWEKAALQYGQHDRVRHRLVQWLYDGRIATITDQDTYEEKLAVFSIDPKDKPELLLELPPGRLQEICSSPAKNQLAFTTSRMELYLIDIDQKSYRLLDHSNIREISEPVFSPCGNWIAYCKHQTPELMAIYLVNLEENHVTQITQPVRYDFSPSFDPDGNYLYFLSSRNFNPIHDSIQIGVSFARSVKPYLLTLRKNISNPFVLQPHAPGKSRQQEEEYVYENLKNSESSQNSKRKLGKKCDKNLKKNTVKPVEIDLENISERIVEFPCNEGIFKQIIGISHKVLITEFELEDEKLEKNYEENYENSVLWCYDFETLEIGNLADEVSWIEVNGSRKTLLYRTDHQLRVWEADASFPEDISQEINPCRKTGWLDLSRIRYSINYASEWRQMFNENWRLQKEFFWREDLPGIDWRQIYDRYAVFLERLGSRSELSDLIWEMQGELGTSHAYEYGGDYHPSPTYAIGKLGADLEFNRKAGYYYFKKIYCGDVWKKGEHSPLCNVGQNISEGDYLTAINGFCPDKETPPGKLLVNLADMEILISVRSPKSRKKDIRNYTIKTLVDESLTRYRDWVKFNARYVSKMTKNRVGYIHIPDMENKGIAEFHRSYLAQTDKEGLIIDVRYNAGGSFSPLILEKLSHIHLGYDVPRWGVPEAYPNHTVHGPLILLCNEFTGSDGDMFCYGFKAMNLGKIIGKRTWGGVIGIDSRYSLVDGTVTTQPQFSAWFHDCRWSLENKGVEPDITVEITPGEYGSKEDPQMDMAIKEIMKILENTSFAPPVFKY